MNGNPISGLSSFADAIQFNATTALHNRQNPLNMDVRPEDVARTAEDFEAFYLTQVTANMFAGIETDPMFGGGPGEAVFQSLLTQEYGKLVARAGGIGIADAVAREMIKLQEAS